MGPRAGIFHRGHVVVDIWYYIVRLLVSTKFRGHQAKQSGEAGTGTMQL